MNILQFSYLGYATILPVETTDRQANPNEGLYCMHISVLVLVLEKFPTL